MRLGALVVVLPLVGLFALAGANLAKLEQVERAEAFDPAWVGGSYSFHEAAPVRSFELVGKAWANPSAGRLVAARGADLFLGVETQTGPFELERVAVFQDVTKRHVDFVQYSRAWDEEFQGFLAEDVWRRGAVPVLTWEPWSYDAGVQGYSGAAVEQPDYALRTITSGEHDAYIRRYARGLKGFGHPLLLRFGPEMNGDWNSWSEGVNGNEAGEYVRAWRRIHRLFSAEGADNVLFVWAPNILFTGSTPLEGLYPGDAYVDVVGVDGYNWGNVNQWSRWRGFDEVFGPTLDELRRLAPGKPILITETASTELGGEKGAWIRGLFAGLRRNPDVVGFTWFNQVKETDWRVQSSPESARAFAAAAENFPQSPEARELRERLFDLERRYEARREEGR